MTYKAKVWVNQVYDDEGNILRKGTPLMAEDMNKIENELENLSSEQPEIKDKLVSHENRITSNKEEIDNLNSRLIDTEELVENHSSRISSNEQSILSHGDRIRVTEEEINSVKTSLGKANGIATLNENGIVPSTQLPSNFKEIKVVPTLVERDSLEKFEGLRVLVLDASSDSTVNSGWAEYVWSGEEFIKVAEAEGIDLVIKWADVEGKPTEFNPKKHSHTESELIDLDKYTKGEVDSKLEGKSDIEHKHLERDIIDLDKYTKQEVDTKLAGKSNIDHRHSASEIDGLYVTHEHNNKEVLDKLTQGTLDKIDSNEQKIENLEGSNHTHSNKGTLDKLVYSGGKSSVDLIALEELERHTHDALHTHSNKQVIDKFTEVDGQLLYNNEEIGGAVPNLTLTELTLGGRFKIVYNDIEDSLDIEVIA